MRMVQTLTAPKFVLVDQVWQLRDTKSCSVNENFSNISRKKKYRGKKWKTVLK